MSDDSALVAADIDPAKFIHVIRGQQVMLDRDLASLYSVETKVFNQAVKRNIARFPERFRFQLTQEEFDNLRSQNVTSSWGGRRYLPYAFTEQGVAMLSAVLRSDTAVEVSIGIMDAFVRMRKFIYDNAALLEKVSSLEFNLLEYQNSADKRFDEIFDYLNSHALPSQKVFFKGEMFDAFALLIELVKSAKKSIVLVDGYVDEATLNLLAKKEPGATCKIVTLPSARLTNIDIRTFEAQYGQLQVVRSAEFHDRFMVIDDSNAYLLGASVKDAGKKTFAIVALEEQSLIQELLSKIREL